MNYNNFGQGQMFYGYSYEHQKKPKYNNFLTQEEKQFIRNYDRFSFDPTEVEMKKAKCFHHELKEYEDCTVTCTNCKESFKLITDFDSIEKAVDDIFNVINTVKTYYLDMGIEYIGGIINSILLVNNTLNIYKKEPIDISRVKTLKAKCTHKDGNQISLKENADGTFTCWICEETFRMVDDAHEVETIVNDFIDVLNSIKCNLKDDELDENTKNLFNAIPHIKKIPTVYKMALDNFKSYDMIQPQIYQPNPNQFSFYDSIVAPGAGYMFQQPSLFSMPNTDSNDSYKPHRQGPCYTNCNMCHRYGECGPKI